MEAAVDVTLVVPCYNTERFLDQALTSAEQNASCRMEILVIDDGSTDGSPDIMRAHERRDPRVRVIRKRNEGYGATVNRGLREAQGTYVAILEPDDYVEPKAYDDMFSLATYSGFPDVIKAPYWRVLSQGGTDSWRAYSYLRGRVHHVNDAFLLAAEPQLIQYHPSVWSALYRRDFLERERIAFVEAPGAGWVDNPFSVETLAAAGSIVYTDTAFYCYREDLANASSATISARLMIDRWNERQDALERRHIMDVGVIKANYVVALRFFARMFLNNALEDPKLFEDACAMARRMEPEVLRTVDCVHPAVIRHVLDMASSTLEEPATARYAAHLATEAWWALRTNGIKFLAHNLMLTRES